MKNSKKFFSKSFLKKTFIIAEIGINHNGRFQKCLNMIKLASRSGQMQLKFKQLTWMKAIINLQDLTKFLRIKIFHYHKLNN